MTRLIDLLERQTLSAAEPDVPGRYDERRGLRVDETGRAVVQPLDPLVASTTTRGGADRDEPTAASLGTVTKSGVDRDEHFGSMLTKTAGGRDVDEDRFGHVLLRTATFSGRDVD